MGLLKYFRPAVPTNVSSLTKSEIQEANTATTKNKSSHTSALVDVMFLHTTVIYSSISNMYNFTLAVKCYSFITD